MILRSIHELQNIQKKRVLVRTDFNIPLKLDGTPDMKEDTRIKMSLPTIEYLLTKKAAIIIATHLGRPKGEVREKLRLDPLAERLAKLLRTNVKKVDGIIDAEAKAVSFNMQEGEILVLENLRFDPREEENDKNFAKELASLAQIYINDAFSSSHRQHASMAAITQFLPSFGGILLLEEVNTITRILKNPKRPFTVIMGGSKIATKIGVMKKFSEYADHILIGGAIANSLLNKKGIEIGNSTIENNVSFNISLDKKTLHLPRDAQCAHNITNHIDMRISDMTDISLGEYILDIGPKTIDEFIKVIENSRTIIWNGPMGVFEVEEFSQGTRALVNTLKVSKADIIIGGGDTLKAIKIFGLRKKKNIHLSSGGGALMKFLEDENLPALMPLKK